MEGKIRVHALAKELGLSSTETVQKLQEAGFDVKSPFNVVDASVIDVLRGAGETAETPKAEPVVAEETTAPAVEEPAAPVKKEAPAPVVEEPAATAEDIREVHVKAPIVVKDLAEALDVKPNQLIAELMAEKVLANINQTVDQAVAEKIAENHNVILLVDKRDKDHKKQERDEFVAPEEVVHESKKGDLTSRPPVVTFMGHVDHGKTSLQDALRETEVTAGEAGGITQHIGASTIWHEGQMITMIDTPGHAAFTAMRARGANTTDVAVIVVAADDGVMPQTLEALQHAQAAGVPMIIAINKMDLEAANPDNVLMQLQRHGYMTEDWGGDIGTVRVSAHTGDGLDELLERVLLEAEMLELAANPKLPAKAVVIETRLETGTGVLTNLLVQEGTLKVGDAVLCGSIFSKVKALVNDKGERIKSAGPSVPVQMIGLPEAPEVGQLMVACKNEKQAKKLAQERARDERDNRLREAMPGTTLEDLFQRAEDSTKPEVALIIKADVKGSLEAIEQAVNEFPDDQVKLNVVSSGVGAISDTDVTLSKASNAILIGFNVRVNPGVNKLAEREGIEIRLYTIIYELLDDVKAALEGKLAPEEREEELGEATIAEIFTVGNKGAKICGCRVNRGVVRVAGKARVYRDNELIYNGTVSSLKRFKDDVKEVKQGFECGIRLDNFNDFEVGDVIKAYQIVLEKAKLD